MPRPTTRRTTVIAVLAAVLIAAPLGVIASDVFTDVPDSNVFHDDITWLADADVTRGCNPPANTEYCPSDNVTREQMAAFMRRLAENRVVAAASAETAENAATLQGNGPADLRSVLFHNAEDSTTNFPGGFGVIQAQTVTVTAPGTTAGAVLVQGGGDLVGNGTAVTEHRSFACWISDDPASTDSNLGAHVTFALNAPISGNVISATFSTTTTFEVAAGESITLYLLCRDIAGNDGNMFRVSNAHLSATFMPGADHVLTPALP
jgi:hypothetical protein